MKITTTSTDRYPTLTNANIDAYITYVPANDITYTTHYSNAYEAYLDSLSNDRHNAIDAAFHNGFLTQEEAKQLKEVSSFVRRNEHTYIQVAETFDKVYLYCNELEDGECTRIFKLAYLKVNGILIDELNTDIAN